MGWKKRDKKFWRVPVLLADFAQSFNPGIRINNKCDLVGLTVHLWRLSGIKLQGIIDVGLLHKE